MKKILTLFIAMGSSAVSSEAATVFNYYTPGTDNYNSTIHGVYLSLGASFLAPPIPLAGLELPDGEKSADEGCSCGTALVFYIQRGRIAYPHAGFMPSGRYGISGVREPYPVFSAWRQFAGNVFETQYRKAFSLPENAGQIRQRAFRPYGTRRLPHSGLSGRIGNPFAAHRPGGPPHTYYSPSYSPALVFRKNGNGPHAQHFIFFSIVCPDDGRCINDVSRRCGCRGRRLHPAPG